MIVPICGIYVVLTSHQHQGGEWLGFLIALIRCGAKGGGKQGFREVTSK